MTDLYVVVANWPRPRRHHWQALLVARAIENQAYVVGVNRVGEGGGVSYAGDSAIIDPLGELLAVRRIPALPPALSTVAQTTTISHCWPSVTTPRGS